MKIYGTLGPACSDSSVLTDMIREGMNGIRLNLSHGMLESFKSSVNELRAAEKACNASVEMVIDMEGPELRVGNIREPLMLNIGDNVVLGRDIPLKDIVLEQLCTGLVCRLDDGKIELEIIDKSSEGFVCRVLRGGKLLPRKSFAVLGRSIKVPLLTDNDIKNLNVAKTMGVSAILQPFVRCADDIYDVKRKLAKLGCEDIEVIAKIEDINGLNNADGIIKAADRVLFARGDLGNSMDMWLLPAHQKTISQKCAAANKSLIIATQLLASMENNPVPTRAEMNDIYNCVLDGADGLMLTGETAAGKYPVQAIRYLKNAAYQARPGKN